MYAPIFGLAGIAAAGLTATHARPAAAAHARRHLIMIALLVPLHDEQ